MTGAVPGSGATRPVIWAQIVTWNHASTVRGAVESLLSQAGVTPNSDLFVHVIDNASTDSTLEQLSAFDTQIRITRNVANDGFCAAHNAGVRLALEEGADYVLLLNPDLRLEKQALISMIRAAAIDRSIGSVCPKLVRADANLAPIEPATIDAAGMYFTPEFRHLDRGSGARDDGTFDRDAFVVGGSGAALLLKREMILDVSFSGANGLELLDENFFAYREDAELALRAQTLGWKCRYVPAALGYHVRRVTPERRSDLPPELNRLGVRNRFLLQLNHFSSRTHYRTFALTTFRNALVVGGVLLKERSSIPAFHDLQERSSNAWAKRKWIAGKRRVSRSALRRWFTHQEEPALPSAEEQAPVHSVAAVVVNYHSGERLRRCLESLARARTELVEGGDISLTALVVDNGSAGGEIESLRDEYAGKPGIEFLLSPENLGFGGAVNRARKQLSSDALLILNPDVEVSGSMVHDLVRAASAHRRLGCVAPALCNSDGSPQLGFTARRFPTLGSALCELFFIHRLWRKNPWTSSYLLADDFPLRRLLMKQPVAPSSPRPDRPYLVDQPAAACILIRTEAFDRIGGFDDELWPAWFEDVDLCKRMREADYFNAVVPSARAVHEGGYSLAVLGRHEFEDLFYRNMVRYWEKHGTDWENMILGPAIQLGKNIRACIRKIASRP